MRRHYSFLTFPIIILLMYIMVACGSSNQKEPEPQETPSGQLSNESTGSTTPEEPYPEILPPTSPPREAYPEPVTEDYFITEIPTPSADLATVTGVLLRGGFKSSSEPASTVLLALAKVVEGPNGEPMVVSFSQLSAPRALTDNSGRFVFVDVPPGHYALIYDRISDAFLLKDPKTGKDYLFVAESGQILNLGELVYESLPGDGN